MEKREGGEEGESLGTMRRKPINRIQPNDVPHAHRIEPWKPLGAAAPSAGSPPGHSKSSAPCHTSTPAIILGGEQ
jgi:hypothetical protein